MMGGYSHGRFHGNNSHPALTGQFVFPFHTSTIDDVIGYHRYLVFSCLSAGRLSVEIPDDTSGNEIHVLLKLSDDSVGHTLDAYQCIVLQVK